MNLDEKRVYKYLKAHFGENVVWEPDGNVPPDFLVDSVIAVEARRLNQNYSDRGKSEGLEEVSIPIREMFNGVLKSFDSFYQGNTYWVYIRFERPLITNMRQAKKDMEVALRSLLTYRVSEFPHKLTVSAKIKFTIFPSQPIDGRVFRPAIGLDEDADGLVIPTYIGNLRHCIIKKSSKVANYLPKYRVWWLYLVDHIGWGLDVRETKDLVSSISDIGNFDGVFIISNNGETLLASKSR
jgi:hypothetical protein